MSPAAYVLILHEVADYTAWKQVFDDAADLRCRAGERSFQVLHPPQDSRQVVHFSRWTSLDAAKAFFESPLLVEIRARAGVQAPRFIYLEEADSGELSLDTHIGST